MSKGSATQTQTSSWNPEGEMTIYTAAENKTALLSAMGSSGKFVIDLSNISEIDSAGLQLLILARREAAKADMDINFANPNDAVMDMLKLCNLTHMLNNGIA